MLYGTIPAAGFGSRLQPLAYSKELALVGEQAIIEYLLERMVLAGIDKIFITINSDKLDIPRYLSTKSPYKDNVVFIVRDDKALTDNIFASVDLLKDDDYIFFGLPDTIWYPKNGFNILKNYPEDVVLGLFSTPHPENFGAVSIDSQNKITLIEDKVKKPHSNWIWGIGKVKVGEAKKMLSILPNSDKPEERLLSTAIDIYKEKYPCYGVKLDGGTYFDIGRKEDYKKADKFIQENEPLS